MNVIKQDMVTGASTAPAREAPQARLAPFGALPAARALRWRHCLRPDASILAPEAGCETFPPGDDRYESQHAAQVLTTRPRNLPVDPQAWDQARWGLLQGAPRPW